MSILQILAIMVALNASIHTSNSTLCTHIVRHAYAYATIAEPVQGVATGYIPVIVLSLATSRDNISITARAYTTPITQQIPLKITEENSKNKVIIEAEALIPPRLATNYIITLTQHGGTCRLRLAISPPKIPRQETSQEPIRANIPSTSSIPSMPGYDPLGLLNPNKTITSIDRANGSTILLNDGGKTSKITANRDRRLFFGIGIGLLLLSGITFTASRLSYRRGS